MGKKYLDTKENTLEAAVMKVWQVAAEEMDPVNPKAAAKKFKDRKDKDIDNDGDVDSSDKYLHKRRKAIGKAMKKEGLEDSPNPANSQHLCAKNVVHEEWGEGQPVHGMHAMPDVDGNIAWYDVMFEHGIEKGVSINELKVTVAEKHHNHGGKKKNEGAMKRGKDMDTFKPKPQEPQNEIIGTAAKLAGKAVGGAAKLAGRTAGTAAKVAGRTVSGVAKGAGSAAAGAIKGTKKAVGGAARGTTKAVGGAASATKKTAGAIMNSEELEMRDYNEYQNFKVQSMRDALEEVWARSVEDKLFEDINLMSEEQFDRFIDSLNEEELDEFLTARSRARRAVAKLDKAKQKVADQRTARMATARRKVLQRQNPGVVRKAASGIASLAKKAKDALV